MTEDRGRPSPNVDSSTEIGTLAEAVAHLTQRGYRGDFRAEKAGLREVFSGDLYPVERLQIDVLFRFEGETDPGDEALVLGLSDSDGEPRGTYVVAFGAQMPPRDAEVMHRLRDRRAR